MTTSILDANALPAWETAYDNYADARQVVIGLALSGGDTAILGHVDFYLYEQQMAQRPWADVWAEPGREMLLRGGRGAKADAVSRF